MCMLFDFYRVILRKPTYMTPWLQSDSNEQTENQSNFDSFLGIVAISIFYQPHPTFNWSITCWMLLVKAQLCNGKKRKRVEARDS